MKVINSLKIISYIVQLKESSNILIGHFFASMLFLPYF